MEVRDAIGGKCGCVTCRPKGQTSMATLTKVKKGQNQDKAKGTK